MKMIYIDSEYIYNATATECIKLVMELNRHTQHGKVIFGDMSLHGEDLNYINIMSRLKHKHAHTISHVPGRCVSVTCHMLVAIQHSITTGSVSDEVIIYSSDANYDLLELITKSFGMKFKRIS